MPWEERDWAKWTDEERDRYLGTAVRRSGGASRPAVGRSRLNGPVSRNQTILAFALIAMFAFFAVHHALKLPTPDPTSVLGGPTPPLSKGPPAGNVLQPRRDPIPDLPPTMRRGTYVTSWGTLGRDVSGVLVVEGRWGSGPWYRLATAPVTNGRYRVRYFLDKPGILHLRIALPDGNYLVARIRVT
jgi:hypothetical protein